MEFKEKQITLKNGQTALFRSPRTEDAEAMLDYIKTACGETNFLARYPEEWSMSVEQEVVWVNHHLTAPKGVSITCFVDGRIAGNCEVMGKSGIKMGHRATIAIAILKEYWGLGIGSAMFEEMIKVAKELGIEIMELEFIEGNDRARHLYEKFGFRVIGERPRAIRLKDGRYLSEFFMQKELVVIHEIHPDDLPACLSVIHESFETVADEFSLTPENCPKHTAFLPLSYLETQMSWGWRMCGLFVGKTIIGYMSLSDEGNGVYELHNLAILPMYRHKGFGKLLLDHAKAVVRELDGKIIKVGIIEESTILKNWYIDNGFVPVGTKKFDHLPFTSGYLEYLIKED